MASNSAKQQRSSTQHVEPFYVDEQLMCLKGRQAQVLLTRQNDCQYLNKQTGIIEVPTRRWHVAQAYEKQTWMNDNGRRCHEDRNSMHTECFDAYRVVQGQRFRRGIELGCGPFTNMQHILRHCKCRSVTLLDPLIETYLQHPNCTYKGRKLHQQTVTIVNEPAELFVSTKQFDLLVLINVLEHCFSASKIFRSVLQLIKPGGTFIFHDKLYLRTLIPKIAQNVYDAGHPLHVSGNLVMHFLLHNFNTLYSKHVSIQTASYLCDSIYFIGTKNHRT